MSVTITERLRNYASGIKQWQKEQHAARLQKQIEKDNRYADTSKHILICGEPRGGTTWVAECFYGQNTLMLWEPLFQPSLQQCGYTKFGKQLGWIPYIPQHENWPEAEQFFKKLLTGQALCYNTVYGYANVHGNFSAPQLLIKFCRANMLLPWLVDRFAVTPIYLVRHPLAVISSQFRHEAFGTMGENSNIFRHTPAKYADIYQKFSTQISAIKTREEMFANWWAISNTTPLNHTYNNKKWITVSYESLLLRPEYELARLSKRLNQSFDPQILERMKKPSATTKSGSGILTGGNQLLNWKKYLTNEQAEKIMQIVNSYGIDAYSLNPEPDYAKLGYE